MTVQELLIKKQHGKPLTEQETAFMIRNYSPYQAAFMIENNPGNVNLTLKKMGFDMPITPDKKLLARQMEIFLERGHSKEWTNIVNNFHVDHTALEKLTGSNTLGSEILKQFN